MSLNAAVVFLQAQASAISGIRVAPSYPTDSAGAFPAVVSYASSLDGSVQTSVGNIRDLYTITTEIHVTEADLPRAIAVLQPMVELFTSKVWSDSSLSNNVDTVIELTGVFDGSTQWGGIPTMCWRFFTKVKCRRTS